MAAKAAGGMRFHDLRHAYATWLVTDGVPINLVQRVMGHEQASTTLNRYTHTPDDYAARVLAAFESSAASLLPRAGKSSSDGAFDGMGDDL
ncbi:tyrosine-type recombinase/integrase [Micromonospora sp. URMC 103]|uniref:tyrosine-type recombinase/integrase n=1 Tax=Micromonospora sp. URMC 103 TaxID=3423406 RepID=UPI003F1C77FB